MSIKATQAINELEAKITSLEQTIEKLTKTLETTVKKEVKKWTGPDLSTKESK